MLDIKFVRENPEIVKENIRKKFQDAKLPLVDEVIGLDAQLRAVKTEADSLRANRTGVTLFALERCKPLLDCTCKSMLYGNGICRISADQKAVESPREGGRI